MGTEGGPVINITASRPVNLEDQRRNQQLPNRNRTIIRRPFPGNAAPQSTNTSGNPEYQRNAEWRPVTAAGRAPFSTTGADAPRHFKSPAMEDSPASLFHQRTADLLNGKAPTRALPPIEITSRSADTDSRKRTATDSQALQKEPESSDAASPPVKKKKIKPALSVPTTAGQISGNWQGLQKSLGLKDRPKRPAKAPEPKESDAIVNSSSTSGSAMEIEIPNAVADTFVKTNSFSGLTKTVALDCEFVGIGPGGRENMLARVSLVNQFGHCVYDKFVKPTELVKDYRTYVSGVRPQDLKKGEDFKIVQKEVSEILTGRTLVGHAVHHDLEVLLLSHPKSDIRDTSKYKPFRQITKGGTPSLKKLTAKILGFGVQTGEHDSVQDAQATMRLYTMYKREWESKVSLKGKKLRMMQKKKPVSSTSTSSA